MEKEEKFCWYWSRKERREVKGKRRKESKVEAKRKEGRRKNVCNWLRKGNGHKRQGPGKKRGKKGERKKGYQGKGGQGVQKEGKWKGNESCD